jgi:hypothetical protein
MVGGLMRFTKEGNSEKAMVSLYMTVFFLEICKENNSRVFRNQSMMSIMLVRKIKDEAGMRCLAGLRP